MLTTIHKHEMIPVTKLGKTVNKPSSVIEYNKDMGAVDRSDMMISFNDSARKSKKWYRKLFFHSIDIVVLNTYNMFVIQQNKKSGFCDFRLNLIRQILETHHTPREGRLVAAVPRVVPPPAATRDQHPLCLTGRHFPRPLPTPEGQTRKTQKRCYVCSHSSSREKKRKDTTFECKECGVPLCIHPCLEHFHTKNKF
ncbi:hypothetical protein J6590_108673 [Homalodisca vitripennis]|nr:hypothetical protein J6590_108673 [Homalodisca vitripennis]